MGQLSNGELLLIAEDRTDGTEAARNQWLWSLIDRNFDTISSGFGRFVPIFDSPFPNHHEGPPKCGGSRLAAGGAEVAMVDRLTGVGIGLAAIAVLVLAGRYLLDLVFRLSARCRRSI